jgi:DNA-binding transcriptional regulator YdaS (Cro superfamily)
MKLREYLALPGAPTVPELRRRLNELGAAIHHDAQIRQWANWDLREDGAKRQPHPSMCPLIEQATAGSVTRRDLRDDWKAIWPELDRRKQTRSPVIQPEGA